MKSKKYVIYKLDCFRFMKNKKGIFLSVELLMFLVVLTILIAMVVMGIPFLLQKNRVTSISSSVTKLRESVSAFYNTYNRYPGDLTADLITGGVMKNDQMLADMAELQKVAPVAGSVTSNDLTFGTGAISVHKNPVAFKQLALDGFDPSISNSIIVNTPILSTACASSAGCYSYINSRLMSRLGVFHYGPSSPKLSVWVLTRETYDATSKTDDVKQIKFSKMYGNSTDTRALSSTHLYPYTYNSDYARFWSGALKATLINPSEMNSTIKDADLTIKDHNIDITKNIASVAPSDAAALDAKMDNGQPFGTPGSLNAVTADGILSSAPTVDATNGTDTTKLAVNGCLTGLPTAAFSSTTDNSNQANSVYNVTYTDDSRNNTKTGCILHVLVHPL